MFATKAYIATPNEAQSLLKSITDLWAVQVYSTFTALILLAHRSVSGHPLVVAASPEFYIDALHAAAICRHGRPTAERSQK